MKNLSKNGNLFNSYDKSTSILRGARPAFYLDDVKGIRLKSIFIDDKKLLKQEMMLIETKSERVEVID